MGASIALLNLTLFAGFLPSVGYTVYLLNKNRSWKEFRRADSVSHWFYGFMMGLPSLAAFLVYGIATIHMGLRELKQIWGTYFQAAIEQPGSVRQGPVLADVSVFHRRGLCKNRATGC